MRKTTTLYILYRFPITPTILDGFREVFKQAVLKADLIDHRITEKQTSGFLTVKCRGELPLDLIRTFHVDVDIIDFVIYEK